MFALAAVIIACSYSLESVAILLGDRTANAAFLSRQYQMARTLSSLTLLACIALLIVQRHRGALDSPHTGELQDAKIESAFLKIARLAPFACRAATERAAPDSSVVFQGVTKMCVELFDCHRASLMLFEKDTEELVVKAVSGYSDRDIIDVRQKIREGIAGWVAVHREPLLVGRGSGTFEHAAFVLLDPTISWAMVVPIVVSDELIGVLNVCTRSETVEYDRADLRVLQILALHVGHYLWHINHADEASSIAYRLPAVEHREGGVATGCRIVDMPGGDDRA